MTDLDVKRDRRDREQFWVEGVGSFRLLPRRWEGEFEIGDRVVRAERRGSFRGSVAFREGTRQVGLLTFASVLGDGDVNLTLDGQRYRWWQPPSLSWAQSDGHFALFRRGGEVIAHFRNRGPLRPGVRIELLTKADVDGLALVVGAWMTRIYQIHHGSWR